MYSKIVKKNYDKLQKEQLPALFSYSENEILNLMAVLNLTKEEIIKLLC